tara:strand:+ start:41 stop:352 length:312 start_codon:yes stop_codon:yes gene_type:complete
MLGNTFGAETKSEDIKMGKELEQEYRENGMGIKWFEAKRFLVTSLRNPMNVHMVDFDEYDGYGECSCEYFQFMIAPKLKQGKQPFKKCRHLRSARRVMERTLT